MDCAQARTVIASYADGEADAMTSAAMAGHLEQCAGCRSALERLNALSTLIKEAAPYHSAPDHLSSAIRARAGVQDASATPPRAAGGWSRWWRPAALVAVTAVVTWVAALQLQPPATEKLVVAEVVRSHARSKVTGHVADVASSERHTVKPWLTSKLDFSPPVIDLASAGYPLAGGRLDYLDDRPVAAVVYRRRQHVIDLFVWPEPEARALAIRQLPSTRGYQIMHWADRGMTFWAISDLNAAELKAFAELFSSAK